jgi:APA family basic amino acid/polyamine antiporter
VIPPFYILTTNLIMVILLIYKPKYTFPGLIIVVLGIPVYYIWRRLNKNKGNTSAGEVSEQ